MIESLEITKLFGERNINLKFDKSLIIMVGQNGCGKTTILNILAAIGTGNLEFLSQYPFERIRLTFFTKNGPKHSIDIFSSNFKSPFVVKIDDKQVDMESYSIKRKPGLKKEGVHEFDNIVNEINLLYIPLSRDLDFIYQHTSSWKQDAWHNSRLQFLSSMDEAKRPVGGLDESLKQVNALFLENQRRTMFLLNRLNKTMTNEMLKSAFSFFEGGLEELAEETEGFDEKKIADLKSAFKDLGVPSDFNQTVDQFFNKLAESRSALSLFNEASSSQIMDESSNNVSRTNSRNRETEKLYTFLANAGLIQGVAEWMKIVQNYEKLKRNAQRAETVFFETVNSFFSESKKVLYFENTIGGLGFKRVDQSLKGKPAKFVPLEKLSSGEKQILIFFALLLLKSKASSIDTLLIDEPELSLHLSWQQKFSTALSTVAPNTQFILATHSPEIIGPHSSNCLALGV